jgi:hypothetical protein
VQSLPVHIDGQGPKPVVAGTDIKIAQSASEHEHLGTLATCYDHLEAIRADWREGERLVGYELMR